MRLHFFLIYLFIVIINNMALAQVNVSINDIAKIHLVDGAGYLYSSYRNDYDLVPQNGQWKSYQVHERYWRTNFKTRDPKKISETRDSSENRFIKTIPPDSISLLLKSTSILKPKFHPADLKISIPELTKQVDTAYLKHVDAKRVKIFNSFFDTPAKLYRLLDTMQQDSWTDYYPYSVIEIVKKQGDTIKVITTEQTSHMLPWKVNNIPTYEPGINHFFLNATGIIHHQLTGEYLPGRIYSDVSYLYANDAFERLKWQELAPENTKYVQQHFNILKADRYNADSSTYTFNPKKLNKHVIIYGVLHITKKDELIKITRFAEDTLATFLKNRAFMIDSCMAKPGCTIRFFCHDGQAYHAYYSWNNQKAENYLKKLNSKQLWPFIIETGYRTDNNWFKLPNGNFALTTYIDDYAVGVSSKYIKKDGVKAGKFVLMIFSPDGKLLEDGSGMK
ncbi:hypothetical protein [Mucilaginibacter lappiensis]|uniref:Uncharacterized protein n=1 Tax=Mucilaginibacter lappiensis TaxID=354630 RepID=A0A841J857_9SPHI|nr:hypothetical protein [Mucilaginibacter lappiensis]MBB6127263.1 hypothetical protein [Mucilaginibacter lappiensis]